jgi:hypothetical protein
MVKIDGIDKTTNRAVKICEVGDDQKTRRKAKFIGTQNRKSKGGNVLKFCVTKQGEGIEIFLNQVMENS